MNNEELKEEIKERINNLCEDKIPLLVDDFSYILNTMGLRRELKGRIEREKEFLKDEIGFLNYLLEYPELCSEKCRERKIEFEQQLKSLEKNDKPKNM